MIVQAAGRVIIGVHYLTDVLAGMGLGLAISGFSLALVPPVERWADHRSDKRRG